jgi:hypothetical protein
MGSTWAEKEYELLEGLGTEAWRFTQTQNDALNEYLSVVPVVMRSHIPFLLPQDEQSDLLRVARYSGTVLSSRKHGDIPKEKLLWSRNYLRFCKSRWTEIELAKDIYHRTGWDPVLGPTALVGLNHLLGGDGAILLGRDLIRWAETYCHPGIVLPRAWTMELGGTGVGMLMMPASMDGVKEEWTFFLAPGCFLQRNLISLTKSIIPMMESRYFAGSSLTINLALGFDRAVTPGVSGVRSRFEQTRETTISLLKDAFPMIRAMGASLSLFMVSNMGAVPARWRFFQCMDSNQLVWGEGVRVFSGESRAGMNGEHPAT